jgi:hypothetical protein
LRERERQRRQWVVQPPDVTHQPIDETFLVPDHAQPFDRLFHRLAQLVSRHRQQRVYPFTGVGAAQR